MSVERTSSVCDKRRRQQQSNDEFVEDLERKGAKLRVLGILVPRFACATSKPELYRSIQKWLRFILNLINDM